MFALSSSIILLSIFNVIKSQQNIMIYKLCIKYNSICQTASLYHSKNRCSLAEGRESAINCNLKFHIFLKIEVSVQARCLLGLAVRPRLKPYTFLKHATVQNKN